MRRPRRRLTLRAPPTTDAFAALAALLPAGETDPAGPPFQGGVAGLLTYEFGDHVEPLGLPRDPDWPDVTVGLYGQLLAFDAETRSAWAIGRGATQTQAEARARRVAAWPEATPAELTTPLAAELTPERPETAYEAAVADVTDRIAAGEIFQANIARGWTARLGSGVAPFALFARLLSRSPAPHAAYYRLPRRAVVSNSPERFVSVRDGRVESRPIKGTRPRGRTPEEDAALARALSASAKDRAENLMIVDLMRNDLSRVCQPGTVTVDALNRLESFANVHHLVSTVCGTLRPETNYADLLRATFPPGSITGAPKVQAMRVIAGHEGPRGPYCGALFWAGVDGGFDSSVLIRTAAMVQDAEGWRATVKTGAGIVADSEPVAEREETDSKLLAIRRALTEAA